jgi:hypothetical protein
MERTSGLRATGEVIENTSSPPERGYRLPWAWFVMRKKIGSRGATQLLYANW